CQSSVSKLRTSHVRSSDDEVMEMYSTHRDARPHRGHADRSFDRYVIGSDSTKQKYIPLSGIAGERRCAMPAARAARGSRPRGNGEGFGNVIERHGIEATA